MALRPQMLPHPVIGFKYAGGPAGLPIRSRAMEDWASGFRIDGAFQIWGTRFAFLVPGGVENGHASVELPCRSAYELADTGTASR